MLPLEHSAILLTFITAIIGIGNQFFVFESGLFIQVLLLVYATLLPDMSDIFVTKSFGLTVERLTRVLGVAGSSLTEALHCVLEQHALSSAPRKTHSHMNEKVLTAT